MTKLFIGLSSIQTLIFALAVLGSATAAVITKVISSGDYITILGVLGVGGGAVASAHVVGTQLNEAVKNSNGNGNGKINGSTTV